jgi:hypothetical protein
MHNVISFLKAVTPTVAIAALAALIAFFQWRTNRLQAETNREKLRLDLYNRRFEIYLRCLNYHEQLMGHLPREENLLNPFFRAFRESRFMFPASSGVHDLLEELLREGRNLEDWRDRATEEFLENTPVTDRERAEYEHSEALQAERRLILERIKPFIPKLEEKLAPFLNFYDL